MYLFNRKTKYFIYTLMLIIPLLIQSQLVYAIGINGIDISDDGQIVIDSDGVTVTLPEDSPDGVKDTSRKQINDFLSQNKWQAMFVVGFFTIAIGGIWVYKIVEFAKSGSSASERQKAISSLITLGVATAILTGITFFTSFATGLLKF